MFITHGRCWNHGNFTLWRRGPTWHSWESILHPTLQWRESRTSTLPHGTDTGWFFEIVFFQFGFISKCCLIKLHHRMCTACRILIVLFQFAFVFESGTTLIAIVLMSVACRVAIVFFHPVFVFELGATLLALALLATLLPNNKHHNAAATANCNHCYNDDDEHEDGLGSWRFGWCVGWCYGSKCS